MRAFLRYSIPSICLLLSVATAAAQSVTPVNAASYANPAMPNGSIAQGSMFVAFGAGLGPASIQYPSPWPFPDNLAGTTIDVTVGSVTKRCFMVYTSAGQIAGILPSDTPVGAGTMTVRYNNAVAGTGPIEVVARSFGIFTINTQGSGPAVATDPLAASAVYTTAASAAPGDFIDIWGTGLGASLNGDDNDGAPQTGNIGIADVKVYVAGVEQPVVYAGRSGCCTAIDQVRITAPNIIGCALPVVVVVNGVPSNYATVSIDPSGAACTPSSVFGGPNLSQLQNGGSFTVGSVNLARTRSSISAAGQTINSTADIAQASYSRITVANVAAYGGINAVTQIGACTVYQISGEDTEFEGGGTSTFLDAGSQLTISGPGGNDTLPKSQGVYLKAFGAPSFPFLSPEAKAQFGGTTYYQQGNTTVTAPGGSEVQAHTASVVVPADFLWTNKPAFGATISRSNGLTVQYTGGAGYDYVNIFGYSVATIDDNAAGAAFICAADPNAGSFTIPSAVLSALPNSPASEDFPLGLISVGGYILDTFNAGLDVESITYSDTTSAFVDYN